MTVIANWGRVLTQQDRTRVSVGQVSLEMAGIVQVLPVLICGFYCYCWYKTGI